MKKVAIVGGGLAGLTCASQLQQRGIPCVVFEAAPAVGGRCSGATYLLGNDVYSNTFRLIDTLGLRQDLIEIPPIAGQFYKGRVFHHRVSSATGLLAFKGLNIADKALLSRMAYLLFRHHSMLDFHHPELGVDLDDESVAAFVKRELSQNILNYVAGPLISTLFFYSSEDTSKLLYLNLARHMRNTRMSTLKGGLQTLVNRLAQRVKVEVGQRVKSIVRDATGYVVNGHAFSDVVIAVSGDSVLAISGMRRLLGKEDQMFFEHCRYGRAVTVSIRTDQVVDKCYAVSIPKVEKLRAATIIHHAFFDPGDRRVTVIGGGDSVNAQELLEDFRRIYPHVTGSEEFREWVAAMPKFPPGRFREIGAFLKRERRPELLFSGDYLMGPFVEAAITSAFEAASGAL